MQQVKMMWASATTAPSSSDASSTLKMHNNRAQITFDLTKPYNGSAIVPAVSGTDRTLNQYNLIVLAHMVRRSETL